MIAELCRARALTVAYVGDPRGTAALEPALRLLRETLPEARCSLLWPCRVPVPAALEARASRHIDYSMRTADRASIEQSINALRDENADWTIIFTQARWTFEAPAYIAYLAGIRRRAGIAAESAGSLLSDAFPEPRSAREHERHLYLLARLGLQSESRALRAVQPAVSMNPAY